MVAVEPGGKELVSHQTPQTSARTRRTLTSRDEHHPTRAPLVNWHGTVNSQGFVLAGVIDNIGVYMENIKHLGVIRALGDVVHEHTVICLVLESFEKHHRGSYIGGVNMEDDTQCHLCLGALHIYQSSATLCGDRVWLLHRMFHRTRCTSICVQQQRLI